jgi:hypothetical protein
MLATVEWLPTTAAAAALGCSPCTLKRKRDICGGFLEAGRHYSLGPEFNSPIAWRVEAVREALYYRGMLVRAGQQALREHQEG